MTRADIVKNIINDDGYYYTKHSVLEIVNVIFNDHEAQMKALYFQITELKMMEEDAQQYALRCSKELKAKDEEIERLKEFEEMFEWMELNSNRSLCDYYNNKDNT